MKKKEAILHIKTGGTIGGCVPEYREIAEITSIFHDPSDIEKYLRTFRIYADYSEVTVCHKDSRAITEQDREHIMQIVVQAVQNGITHILITHGTYTMPETGRYLIDNLPKEVVAKASIIITGSMYPLNIIGSDATLNLGAALSTLINATSPLGVVINMHGKNWDPKVIRKNASELIFEEI